jgi:ubiquinone/menaquinone biosynthesis C-methylase UbiE
VRLTEMRPESGFTKVDAIPAGTVAALVEVLDQTAALPPIQRIRQLARAAMDIRDGARLLDAGCGLGEEARELARLAGPKGAVTGIDLSRVLVAEAEQRDNGTGVRYAVGDITALDFPDATFDAVRSERVIQHVPDPDAAIKELVRVTIPGGRVCAIDTDWDSFGVDGVPTKPIDSLKRLAREKGRALKPAGRQLRGQFVRAGLTAVTAEPVAIPMTDRHTAEFLSPVFNRRSLELMLDPPRDLMNAWFGAFDDALARNEFLAVLTIWVVAGTRPA